MAQHFQSQTTNFYVQQPPFLVGNTEQQQKQYCSRKEKDLKKQEPLNQELVLQKQNSLTTDITEKDTIQADELSSFYSLRNQFFLIVADVYPIKQQTNKYSHPKLDFLFKKQILAENETPYYLDGDPNMYTDEAIKKRKELRTNKSVVESLNRVMEIFSFDRNNLLNKHEYYRTMLKIAELLRQDLTTKDKVEELGKLIELDWKRDSKGKERISRMEMIDGLFELADIWTPDIDEAEYTTFFEILRFRSILDDMKGSENKIDIYDIIK